MKKSTSLTIPHAILIAGVCIAGAILIASIRSSSVGRTPTPAVAPVEDAGSVGGATQQASLVLPVELGVDHVRGATDGQITIYEYSDIDCPFCKRFHDTLRALVAEYDEVRWVYRHLPLEGLHPEAFQKAVITECVFNQAGPDAFWEVLDDMYDNPGSLAALPNYSDLYDLDAEQYDSCLESDAARQRVERDIANAFATRGSSQIGTPWSIVEFPDGSVVPLSGAQPLSVLRGIVESILAEG